ncbi:MAG: cytochrome c biogenesis protein CcsA [Deltaproteobacteria bacterium]|nr:cytochrome c biogenesis protein CcsA [Deltaproteobacteria bacterium]
MTMHLLLIFALLAYVIAAYLYTKESLTTYSGAVLKAQLVLIIGLCLHFSFLLFRFLVYGRANLLGFPTMLCAVSLLLGLSFLIFQGRYRLTGLGIFVMPLTAFLMGFSALTYHLTRETSSFYISLDATLAFHLVCSALSLVAFCLAFVVSVARVFQGVLIREKKFSVMQRKLPALKALDAINQRLLGIGFVLMFLGVVAGVAFAFSKGIDFTVFDQRIVWSMVTLIVYGFILLARRVVGWRGRKAAWGAIAGFVVILASFVSFGVSGAGFHVF